MAWFQIILTGTLDKVHDISMLCFRICKMGIIKVSTHIHYLILFFHYIFIMKQTITKLSGLKQQ